MCYYISLLSETQELEEFFDAEYHGEPYHREFRINGFANPKIPVILDSEPNHIVPAQWGFLPSWAKDQALAKKTLNARMEEIHEKPTFRNAVNNRCLIPVNAFHEWKHLDAKGKQKDNYLISIKNQSIFTIGGLYNIWTDPSTDRELLTVTIGTTDANPLMAEIHNTKKRMPILLTKQNQYTWLDDIPVEYFLYPEYDPPLEAENLTNIEGTATLF
ncbi:SOS response-associated peptidase [Chryseobacterium koreense]|uniref:Abasic site processing protein n=1 Tax=Chryseobacterium koreense CCUG 49689 TaxID=1304281 RepID=A0A0J7IWZ3_9FLAO|nr:SOS response-associated peptidase [Chryseobacterium koreense]KMQ70808.1 hypothetical protein ACM44_09220 [Chryseobacterium koreense CCUG 49689]MBB5332554.1 putative SOS response-associated peptidase YedK [Chryseobacterium koreense]